MSKPRRFTITNEWRDLVTKINGGEPVTDEQITHFREALASEGEPTLPVNNVSLEFVRDLFAIEQGNSPISRNMPSLRDAHHLHNSDVEPASSGMRFEEKW